MDKRKFAPIHSKSLEAHRAQVAARPGGDPVSKGAELGAAPEHSAKAERQVDFIADTLWQLHSHQITIQQAREAILRFFQ